MAEQSYTVKFQGYRREVNWKGLPGISGIYCVYACTYDPKEKEVSIRRLLYIGESGNVKTRVPEDPEQRRDVWAGMLRKGEELCVNRVEVRPVDRERIEAALIYHHNPPCNTEYVDYFPFDNTTVTTSGSAAKLSKTFTVERDD